MNVSVSALSLLLCLSIGTSVYSQKRSSSHKTLDYCANAESRRAMDECQIKIRDKAEAAMNLRYNRFMSNLNEVQKKELKQSQEAWGKYRDGTCALASDLMYQTCIIEVTKKRTAELQEFPRRFLD